MFPESSVQSESVLQEHWDCIGSAHLPQDLTRSSSFSLEKCLLLWINRKIVFCPKSPGPIRSSSWPHVLKLEWMAGLGPSVHDTWFWSLASNLLCWPCFSGTRFTCLFVCFCLLVCWFLRAIFVPSITCSGTHCFYHINKADAETQSRVMCGWVYLSVEGLEFNQPVGLTGKE